MDKKTDRGWVGSTDEKDKSGVASFKTRHLAQTGIGKMVTFRMESFTDFHAVCCLVDEAYENGKSDMAAHLKNVVDQECVKHL